MANPFASRLALPLALCATLAQAQPPADPLSLASVVHVGDDVIVIDAVGRTIRGTVRALGETSLTVDRRRIDAATVASITRTDSLANGTWMGVAVGAGLSLVGLLRCAGYAYAEEKGLCDAAAVTSLLLTAPVGAFLGRAIDQARGDREVYRRSSPVTAQLHLSWTRRGPAAAATFAW